MAACPQLADKNQSSLNEADLPEASTEHLCPSGTRYSGASGILSGSPKLSAVILAILACIAALSLVAAVRESLVRGVDFQWSGAHLLVQHLDPWKIELAGDPDHLIQLDQVPNYLHEFYILLLPAGYLTLSRALALSCVLNLLQLTAALWLVTQLFELDRTHSVLLTLLVVASTPFRMTIANGQQSIFILLMMTLFFYVSRPGGRGVFLGLSYSKYSFSPLLVFFLLLKGRFKILLVSAIPPAVGLLLTWLMLGGSLRQLAPEPFQLSRYAVGLGYGDLMTPIEMTLRSAGFSPSLVYLIPTCAGMLAAAIAAFLLARAKALSEKAQFAIILTLTLFCFKHLLYDYVVLAVPMAIVLTARKSTARTVALIGILYFWFGTTLVNRLFPELNALGVAFNGIVLLCTAISIAVISISSTQLSKPSDPIPSRLLPNS